MTYKKIETAHQECLECGKEVYGRPEKKFCSLECKNSYNNRKTKYWRYYHNKTITHLNINHRILDSLIRDGVKSADLLDLEHMGFVPDCITGYRKGRNGHNEYRCFDIVYCQSENKVFKIRTIRPLPVPKSP